MTKIRLVYFNARGRAELSRLILAQAGQEYEDVRISKDEWPAMKPGNTYKDEWPKDEFLLDCQNILNNISFVLVDMPGGQLPVLEIDGEKIGQSITIARFLANKFHLTGKTEIEKAKADMILDCIQDIGNGKDGLIILWHPFLFFWNKNYN